MKSNISNDQAGSVNHHTASPVRGAEEMDKDLPGYPHYPPSEDIMNPGNGFEKTGTDVEELANSKRLSSHLTGQRGLPDDILEEEDELQIVNGTEADLTNDDLIILGADETDADLGDDERTVKKARVDALETEDELDIPGSELDDNDEAIGEEDEENNYYSLGGDRHDNLEEDLS